MDIAMRQQLLVRRLTRGNLKNPVAEGYSGKCLCGNLRCGFPVSQLIMPGKAADEEVVCHMESIVTLLQVTNLTTHAYDATGNLTLENLAGSLTSYAYDDENRLTGIQFPAGTLSTYSYNGDGLRRNAFEVGSTLPTFIWDGSDYLMEKN